MDSPFHHYLATMRRAVHLVGLVDAENQPVAACSAAALQALLVPDAGAREVPHAALEARVRRMGELLPVGPKHTGTDRTLWMCWADAPATFREHWDYVTPKQTQVLARVADEAEAASEAAKPGLLRLFRTHVRRDYSDGACFSGGPRTTKAAARA